MNRFSVRGRIVSIASLLICIFLLTTTAHAQTSQPLVSSASPGTPDSGDTAWMLTSSALVMLMVPGLALFYAGMVRRKNVLATMMHSMVALAVVGVYWVAIGYSLAFGNSIGGVIGFRKELIFLSGVQPDTPLPGTNIP